MTDGDQKHLAHLRMRCEVLEQEVARLTVENQWLRLPFDDSCPTCCGLLNNQWEFCPYCGFHDESQDTPPVVAETEEDEVPF